MSEYILPCPMCGQPFTQVRWIGFTHTHNGAFTAGYRGECCNCGLTTRAFDTESEAVAAWNMRAERTCRKVIPDEMEGYVFCSECGAEIGEYGYPNYCHSCGAKVVVE